MKSEEGGGMSLTNMVPREYSYNDSETRNQILIQFKCICVFTCMCVCRCICTFVCTSVEPEDDSGVILSGLSLLFETCFLGGLELTK